MGASFPQVGVGKKQGNSAHLLVVLRKTTTLGPSVVV